jgi:hypothetical protein
MHVENEGHRQVHSRFSLNMNGQNLSPDGVQLAWSDDGGFTFGNPVAQTVQSNPYPASYGQYQWRRLGYARDRVYQVSWTGGGETTLNGAWVDLIPQMT